MPEFVVQTYRLAPRGKYVCMATYRNVPRSFSPPSSTFRSSLRYAKAAELKVTEFFFVQARSCDNANLCCPILPYPATNLVDTQLA